MGWALEETIASIERAGSIEELTQILQSAIERLGFASFSFLDAARPGDQNPKLVTTVRRAFERDYRVEGLIDVDPCISAWRRRNSPFTWGSVHLPKRLGKRLPGAQKTMKIAWDHGYTEGITIPFHCVDRLGRPFSSVCTLFWTEKPADFERLIKEWRLDLHVMFIYWAQRAIDLIDREKQRASRFLDDNCEQQNEGRLTDRERDVLSWAARGKTVSETAIILGISEDTVETHVRNAMRRVGAATKTQAVAKAIMLRAIDI